MTEPITLAHISDLHLTPIVGFSPGHWNVKRGLGYLNWARSRRRVHSPELAAVIAADIAAQAPDHVAVTGDLANIGLPGEFGPARAWLETLGPPERVTVVPGNHDIYTTRMIGQSCLDCWHNYLTSDDFGLSLSSVPAEGFPFVRRAGSVALIGLNSAIPTRPFVAAGRIGTPQMEAAAAILSEIEALGLMRVVLIHHPPLPGQTAPRRALADAEDLRDVLQDKGADLVLHGHNHVETLEWLGTRSGALPVIGAASGSAILAHGKEPLARYSLFRLKRTSGGIEIEITVRGLADAGGSIVELSRRRLNPAAHLTPV